MRTFILPLNPIPKARPRFNSQTGRTYTPSRTTTFQNEVRIWVCRNLGQFFEYPMYDRDVPVCVDIDFIFKRPGKLNTRRCPDGLLWRPSGDDKDNLEKAVFDALNGILWHDDRQIVDGRIRKLWAGKGEDPRICIVVKTAGDPPQASCDFWNAHIMDSLAGRRSGV